MESKETREAIVDFWRLVLTNKFATPLKKFGAVLLSRTSLTAWARLHTGQSLKVDLSSSVGRSIWLRGIYEPEVEAYISRVLKPGDAFIDVGAHVGYFSVIAASIVGNNGEVHCFEPNRKVFELLKASIAFNELRNVHAHPVALWSKSGALVLITPRDSGFSYVRTNESRYNAPGDIVQAITLDQYASQSVKCQVKLIKLDVEGAEYHVLLGMQRILQSQSPCLILEAQDWSLSRFGHNLADIFVLLGGYGYRAFYLTGQPVRDVEEARQRLQDMWVKNLIFEIPI